MSGIDELAADVEVNDLPQEIHHKLEQLIKANLGLAFPALVITVIQRGRVLVNKAWGWIDPETRQFPTRTDSLFDLASISKMFTVSAFLSLASEGKVGLDDPLIDYVPEFGASGLRPTDGGQDPHSKAMLPVADHMRGQWIDPARVTLRHLATHTSGLAPWRAVYAEAGPPPAPPTEAEPFPRSERWKRGLAMICNSPFVGEPGDRVRYSDLGMMLLGEVVTRLHNPNGDLDTAIQERIVNPLGLASVGFNPVRRGRVQNTTLPTEMDADWRKRRPWGEVHDENACGLAGIAGHAGLFGTARDIASFGQAWLENDSRLDITPALMREAVTEQSFSDDARHGLGWVLQTNDSAVGQSMSEASYGHTGFTGTSLWIDPRREMVIVCLTNRVYYGREREGVIDFRRALHDLLAL
jgi:serine-type D-Ala-D-Ala carboxypeptidase